MLKARCLALLIVAGVIIAVPGPDAAAVGQTALRAGATTAGRTSSPSASSSLELPLASHVAYDFSRVDEFLAANVARAGGGLGLILIQDGEVIYRKVFGDWTFDKVVPIGSASKGISGGVIAALVDRGRLRLDTTAGEYLPEFTGDKAGITIREMFSHTHGFPEGPHHHRDTKITMPEAVRRISGMDPVAKPGTALYYSGIGMQVAGRIAEIVAGKKWVQLFRETIGEPLGMTATHYYAFGETENPNVAGSVATTLDDYGNFVWMLLNDGRFRDRQVLSPDATRMMLTNQTGNVPALRHAYAPYERFQAGISEYRYGIGWWLELDSYGLTSRAVSGGAFGCQPWVDRDRQLAGVFLPYTRTMRTVAEGLAVNEASVVWLELMKILDEVVPQRPAADAGANVGAGTGERR